MKTYKYIITTCAVASILSMPCNAQTTATDTKHPFTVNMEQDWIKKAATEDETGFIHDDDIKGEIKTYLMDMIVGKMTEYYGSYFYPDDKMAAYISWDDDGNTAYVKNLSTLSDVWVKGEITDNKLWIPTGQPIFRQKNSGRLYQLIIGLYDATNNSMESLAGINFTFNEDRTSLTMDESDEEGKRLVCSPCSTKTAMCCRLSVSSILRNSLTNLWKFRPQPDMNDMNIQRFSEVTWNGKTAVG